MLSVIINNEKKEARKEERKRERENERGNERERERMREERGRKHKTCVTGNLNPGLNKLLETLKIADH